MAKKVDLEAAFRFCSARSSDALQAEIAGDFSAVLNIAESCLPRLRESIAYLRRFQSIDAPKLIAVELILRYAPPMFAPNYLNAVEEWCAKLNRSERNCYPNLPAEIESARHRMALAARIWPHWPSSSSNQLAESRSIDALQIIDVWRRFGAIEREGTNQSGSYRLVSHPKSATRGKCNLCGSEDRAPLFDLLKYRKCPRCQQTGMFTIVGRVA